MVVQEDARSEWEPERPPRRREPEPNAPRRSEDRAEPGPEPSAEPEVPSAEQSGQEPAQESGWRHGAGGVNGLPQAAPSRPLSWHEREAQEHQREQDRLRGPVEGPLVREYRPPYRRQSGQVAAVLMYRNGGHSVRWPDRQEEHHKPWYRGFPYTVFEVLLGRNVTSFELRLPAAGDAEFFQATARVHWEVTDPFRVVRCRVWNAADLLYDDLYEYLRGVSRRYRLDQSEQADEAVRAALASGELALGQDLGLLTRVRVFIDLSDRAVGRIRRDTSLDDDLVRSDKEHAVRLRQERHEQQLIRVRARELEEVLLRGDAAEIAQHMARDPERALEIRRLFREEQREGEEDRLALLSKLISQGMVERHDIGEHMYEALQYLRERGMGGLLGGAVTALPAQRQRELASGDGTPERHRPFWEEERDQGGERRVHEPTRVESAAELAEAAQSEGRRPRSRPSDQFDDWDEE